MPSRQCPFDAVTLSDDTKTEEEMDAELDAHLQKHHCTTLRAVRKAEDHLPRTSPYDRD